MVTAKLSWPLPSASSSDYFCHRHCHRHVGVVISRHYLMMLTRYGRMTTNVISRSSLLSKSLVTPPLGTHRDSRASLDELNIVWGCYLVAMRRNWSEADNRISRSGLNRTRSMMKVCHDLSLHRFSKHCGYKATANVKTSSASRHRATSSGLKLLWFCLKLMNGACNSSMVPFIKDRSPPAEDQANRIIDKMTTWKREQHF